MQLLSCPHQQLILNKMVYDQNMGNFQEENWKADVTLLSPSKSNPWTHAARATFLIDIKTNCSKSIPLTLLALADLYSDCKTPGAHLLSRIQPGARLLQRLMS